MQINDEGLLCNEKRTNLSSGCFTDYNSATKSSQWKEGEGGTFTDFMKLSLFLVESFKICLLVNLVCYLFDLRPVLEIFFVLGI